ncbi:MAG: hypothetical protein JSU94_02615 [Phycisphaerales bacterium]|nr:MAG: hypothetical protein JSU94_02615 [Phycisphaerales bacterium]
MTNTFFNLRLVLASLAVSSAGAAVRAELVACRDFEDGDGAVVTDRYGDDHGVLKGRPQWVKGRYGREIEFEGIDDCTDRPSLRSAPRRLYPGAVTECREKQVIIHI